MTGADLLLGAVLVEGPDADGTAALDEHLVREPSLADLGRGGLDRGDERALDLGTGRVAAGVDDARDGVAALAGERRGRHRTGRSAHPSR